ncbi:MAG: RNA polymerase sigma factor, partial [Planctomycetota bacterium]
MPSDEALAEDFAESRDPKAYEEIVHRYAKYAFNVAFGILHDEALAEDATQNAFLSLLKSAPSGKPILSLRAWIGRAAFTSALNILRTEERRRKREEKASMEKPVMEDDLPGEDAKTVNALKKMVRELPWKLRAPVVLKYFQKTPQADIAQIMGCSPGTVTKRLSKALGLLRARLAQAGLTALVPGLESLLQGIPENDVSSSLIQTLCRLPESSTSAPQAVPTHALPKIIRIGAGAAVLSGALLAILIIGVNWGSLFSPGAGPGGREDLETSSGTGPGNERAGNPIEEAPRGIRESGLDARKSEGVDRSSHGDPSPPAPGEGDERMAVLRGKVIDERNRPVPSARIRLTLETSVKGGPDADAAGYIKTLPYPDETLAETSCNKDGEFTFFRSVV